MRICFLLTHIPDPRTNKRIDFLRKFNDVFVICARRKTQNIWNPNLDNAKYTIYDIDLPPSRKLIKRFFVSCVFQSKAYKDLLTIRPDIIYTEGLDCLRTASKYKRKFNCQAIFYEVADLRESYLSKPKSFTQRFFTRIILRSEEKHFSFVDYLVLTSLKFYDAHYKSLISNDKVIFMPNVPDSSVFADFHKKETGPYTVGFIGGIRYLEQMKMLVDAAECVGCNVLFAGAGGTNSDFESIKEYCSGKRNIVFYGKYNYAEEISKIYGMVDCVYAVYDADNPNVRIALPNKLYESIVCGLPIIVAKNTYLSELVETWKVGFSVGHKNKEELVDCLRELIAKERSVAFERFDSDLISIDHYNVRLREVIDEIARKRGDCNQ